MADNRYSKSKSWKHQDVDTKSLKSRKRKHDTRRESSDHPESKTPPLPVKYSTIEDLIEQRKSLKEELKKMKKSSKYRPEDKNKDDKKDRNSKNSHRQIGNFPKEADNYNPKKRSKTQSIREDSPIHNLEHFYTDSEDEESIIEQRRKQRRQLLEKFNCSKASEMIDKSIRKDKPQEKGYSSLEEVVTSPNEIESAKEARDMFSEKDFISNNDTVKQDNTDSGQLQLNDNWDDSDGYYNVKVGDLIDNNKYVVKSILGQGVFANVILAQDTKSNKSDVAIKIMRNNDLIYKTGLKELAMLKEINGADPENKYHCVKLLGNFMHKGHLCLALEPLYMDLRHVIKKYGRHGLNMKAVMSYSRQLLLALRLLKKIGIVHADVKPDNILVNEKKNILKLCDFGSASKVGENEMTPYLVSRFYRAPEIILGIPYKHSVDVWSTACSIFEMATGKIMFTGSSNNKMLKCFMDLKGKFPGRLIRKGKFRDQHFNYNNNFLLHKKDEASGREKYVEVINIAPTRDLLSELKKYKSFNVEDDTKITQLKDLLEKMLMLDYHQRISVTDGLKHPFIQEPLFKI